MHAVSGVVLSVNAASSTAQPPADSTAAPGNTAAPPDVPEATTEAKSIADLPLASLVCVLLGVAAYVLRP